jgi:hypothetical protein
MSWSLTVTLEGGPFTWRATGQGSDDHRPKGWEGTKRLPVSAWVVGLIILVSQR